MSFLSFITSPSFSLILLELFIGLFIMWLWILLPIRKLFFPIIGSRFPFSNSNTCKLVLMKNGNYMFKRTGRKDGLNVDEDGQYMQEFKETNIQDGMIEILNPKTGKLERVQNLRKITTPIGFVNGTGLRMQIVDEDGILPFDRGFQQVPMSVAFFDRIAKLRAEVLEKRKALFHRGYVGFNMLKLFMIVTFLCILAGLAYVGLQMFF